MPVYDYQCKDCGHAFTKTLKISERNQPLQEGCKECGNENIQMVIGTPLVSYSQPGVLRTTDNFNDRMKEMKKNFDSAGKANMDKVIR